MSRRHPFPPRSQAERIIHKFGGAARLSKILTKMGPKYARDVSQIYRWTYSSDKGGTDGVIPRTAMDAIVKAARYEGILLTEKDFNIGKIQE